jgi:hypothetical protein
MGENMIRCGRTAAWAAVMTLAVLLIPLGMVHATPVEVTLFPSFARVTERSRVPVRLDEKGRATAVLILPGRVPQESLTISPESEPGLRITGLSWRTANPPGSVQAVAMQKQLAKLKDERMRNSAMIKGLDAEISFWTSQAKAKTKTLRDAAILSTAISRNTKRAWQEKMTLEGECENLDQRIKKLSDEMKQAAGEGDENRELPLMLTGPNPGRGILSFKYTYVLPHCGWSPRYRLEGTSSRGQVDFFWDAEVWQNSTQDWSDVELSLGSQTAVPVPGTPEKSPEWKLDASKAGKRKNIRKEEGNGPSAPLRTPMAIPVRSLGRHSLPKGQKQILGVDSAHWPATFSRVIRPFSQPSSLIRAEVLSPSPMEIPQSPALFLMDGELMGIRDFEFYGLGKTLFFGSDPSVFSEVKMVSKPRDPGENPSAKQDLDWHWRTLIQNKGSQEVRVVVEEPVPQIRDRRITSVVYGEPAFFNGQSNVGLRELVLTPGGSRTLETSVHIEAPRDIELEMSWSP